MMQAKEIFQHLHSFLHQSFNLPAATASTIAVPLQ